MVWTPFPRSLVTRIANIFRGSTGRILWKLFVLVVGAVLIVYTVAATSSYIILAIVGIVVTIALSSTVRAALADIWRLNFYKL